MTCDLQKKPAAAARTHVIQAARKLESVFRLHNRSFMYALSNSNAKRTEDMAW